jgi:hypothetical protein
VLKDTVLDRIGNSLPLISDGEKFIIDCSLDSNQLKLSFSGLDVSDNDSHLFDVSICLFVTGDLKFYAQMLGRDNMSGSWCMWCHMAPNEWNKEMQILLKSHIIFTQYFMEKLGW